MKNISYAELSSMSCDQIMALVEERKKASPIDIDARIERNLARLSMESMILRRETQLSYRDLMVSYDI